MNKYRKNSEIVQAVRFDPYGEHKERLPEGVTFDGRRYWVVAGSPQGSARHEVTSGAWIVKGSDGRVFQMRNNNFEYRYSLMPTQDIAQLTAELEKVTAERNQERERLDKLLAWSQPDVFPGSRAAIDAAIATGDE